MPQKRALVECAVLSLQDSCVFYPSCKGCFSRIDIDSSRTRLSCSKCGYSCARGLPDYRFRLSLRVARGSSLFGVTVFGNGLNQFFGIDASGLQRLVTDKTGPLETKSALLLKAVEDCFIGKHFIFGIKVTESENEPWMGRSTGSNDMVQLLATQMILPPTTGLRGCTVLSYFEKLLQKPTESKLYTTDHFKNAQLQIKDQCPIPQNAQSYGFANETFCSPGFHPLSHSRSHHLDSSLSPTPPWQQSLGLITSSAEQEEKKQDVINSPYFIKNDVQSTGFSPSAHKSPGLALHGIDYSTPDLNKSIFTVCHEEFPLSESLTQFLRDKNTPENVNHTKLSLDPALEVCNESKITSAFESNEGTEDEQSESGVYNCSADLFSNSPRMDSSAETSNISQFQSVYVPLPTSKGHINTQPPVDTSSLTSKQPLSEKISKTSNDHYNIRGSFQLRTNLDFIPMSQSTPAEKGKFGQPNLRTKYARKCRKENIVNAENQVTLHYCATPTGRYKKIEKLRYDLRSSSIYKQRSNCFGNDSTDNTLIVPPTPVNPHKAQFKLKSKFVCKLSDSAVKERDCPADADCDWSRDLFSDSV